LAYFWAVEGSQTSCDSIEFFSWRHIGDLITCKKENTDISNSGLTLSHPSEPDLKMLYFYNNKKVLYLPVELYCTAPNLFVINAAGCAVKAISKKNFEKLANVQYVWLHDNDISVIPAGTFEDLVSLKEITLGKRLKIRVAATQIEF
jgi:Leucine-rich repeat (LRR) protein